MTAGSVRDDIGDWLASRYHQVAATPTDVADHLPTFVEKARAAGLVIELGVRGGNSTTAWLHGLWPHGHLISVDVDPAPPIGSWPHWHHLQGDDLDPDTLTHIAALVGVYQPAGADVVFIDTSHRYSHTLAELDAYALFLRPGGTILLHDTEIPHAPGDPDPDPHPVKRAMIAWCEANGAHWTNTPICWGLGTVTL